MIHRVLGGIALAASAFALIDALRSPSDGALGQIPSSGGGSPGVDALTHLWPRGGIERRRQRADGARRTYPTRAISSASGPWAGWL